MGTAAWEWTAKVIIKALGAIKTGPVIFVHDNDRGTRAAALAAELGIRSRTRV